jgi:hypothetical protein
MINLLHPITFSIPDKKITKYIFNKTKIISDLIPGKIDTYIYINENDYYEEYKKSYFALTIKKGGWDCLRHYEIIANGCIPYFYDIENCPKNTLALFPKELIVKGNELCKQFELCGINNLQSEDKDNYHRLLSELMEYLKNNLTTKSIAKYILDKTNKTHSSNILYLSGDINPDYLRCLTLHGFKELFGEKCHDYPKINHIYKDTNINYSNLYGKGITYTNLLSNNLHDNDKNENILHHIINKDFDLVIYGSYGRGMPYYELISDIYNPNDIILLYGEDEGHDNNFFVNMIEKGHHVFVRELH